MRCMMLIALCGLFAAAGCKEEPPSAPPQTPPTPTVESEGEADRPVTFEDVTEVTGAYAQQKLDAMAQQFAQLQAAAAARGEQAEAKFAELKSDFDARLAEARQELSEFKAAAAPHAEAAKQKITSALDEANAILQDAWSRWGGDEDDEANTPAE